MVGLGSNSTCSMCNWPALVAADDTWTISVYVGDVAVRGIKWSAAIGPNYGEGV